MRALAHTHTRFAHCALAQIGSYISGVCNMGDFDPEAIRNTMPGTTHAISHPVGPKLLLDQTWLLCGPQLVLLLLRLSQPLPWLKV